MIKINKLWIPDDIAIGYASFPFSEWKEYGAQKTDWTKCRTKMGPVFKSCDGKFISDHNNWGWGGGKILTTGIQWICDLHVWWLQRMLSFQVGNII